MSFQIEWEKNVQFLCNYQYMVSFLFIMLVYHNIFLTYGFADDYTLLWSSARELPYDFNMTIQGGRLLYATLIDFFFRNAYYVDNLKYLRFIGLLGTWVGSVVIFRYLLWLKWEDINAFFISLLFATTPSFAFYIGWASTCLVPWAFLLSVFSCILILRYLNNSSLVLRSLIYILSISLMECSLFIYQPSATGFFIPLILYVLVNPKLPRNQLFIVMSVLVLSFVLYMLLFKLSLMVFNLSKLDRATLNPNIIMSVLSFFYTDLKQIIRLNYIYLGEIAKCVVTTLGYATLLLFLFKKCWETVAGKMFYWNLAFLVLALPLTNLPRIASSENWVCYRSLGVTGVYLLIVFCYMINMINNKPTKTFIMFLFSISMTISCYYNINYKFINFQVTEYKRVYSEIKNVIKLKPDEVIIVRPAWYSHTEDVFADEYGLPSNFPSWVSVPFMNLVVEKETGKVNMIKNPINGIYSNQIKLQVYNHGEKYENSGAYPVINIKEILGSQ